MNRASELPGVYRSQHEFVNEIDLLILNELRSEPHNVFFKCFASQKKEREAAFAVMEQMNLWQWSPELWTTVSGLHSVFQRLEGGEMKVPALTPEYLRKLGEGMREQIIATLSAEERLAGLEPEQRLAGLEPTVIEAYLRKQRQSKAALTRSPKTKSASRKTKKGKGLPS